MSNLRLVSVLGLLGVVLLFLGAEAIAQSGGFADRTGRDRPGTDGGHVPAAATGAGTVVIKCSEATVAVPASTGSPNGNCSCASTGTGSASCSCTAASGAQSPGNAVISDLVLDAFYAGPGVSQEVLDDVANAESCMDAVMVLESASGSRSTGSCDFSNLWYSCKL